MIFEEPESLEKRIKACTGKNIPSGVTIFTDTTEFMSIEAGDVLRLGGGDYLVTGHAREGRFGIDEQPKFWVKKVVDLTTGEKKIVKLVFYETFASSIGSEVFQCSRSPEKEAAIMAEMSRHPHFMHGRSVPDAAGNLVRILDVVAGPSLYDCLRRLDMPHADYYHRKLPDIMEKFILSVEAIAQLHEKGLHHGDIRADHIVVEKDTNTYVWIDFDYRIDKPDYDLFCLGNVLQQVVGKGRHSLENIRFRPSDYPDWDGTLTAADMNLMLRHRVANLRKLFPHIAKPLNDILMRFSVGGTAPYASVTDLLADLRRLFPASKG